VTSEEEAAGLRAIRGAVGDIRSPWSWRRVAGGVCGVGEELGGRGWRAQAGEDFLGAVAG
jgi:hypothetical protein